mgnify:CR=1 FL=1
MKYKFLVGSFGLAENEAIHLLEWDESSKQIREIAGTKGIEAPSYLTYDAERKMCYAISETNEGLIASYQVREGIVETSRRSTGDKGPCHVTRDSTGNFVIVANYGGGSLSLHPLEANGSILEYSDRVSFVNRDLDKASHPHICYPLGESGVYLVTDLGKDKLYLFRLDDSSKKLRLLREMKVTVNSGPRHVAYHSAKSILYVVNEFSSTVTVFRFDQEAIELRIIQDINAVSHQTAKRNYSADIHLTPDGKWLYVSNRGENVITSFQVMTDGRLVRKKDTSVHGQWPRNFVITPDGKYVLVANEHSNNITVFSICESGELCFEGVSFSIYKPTCLCMVDPFTPRGR